MGCPELTLPVFKIQHVTTPRVIGAWVAGGPHLRGKYNACLAFERCHKRTGGAPLLAHFEKWPIRAARGTRLRCYAAGAPPIDKLRVALSKSARTGARASDANRK